MFAVDLTHTSHTRARTGIQQVCRAMFASFGADAVAVTHDPYLGEWRQLASWEKENLAAPTPGAKRGAHWPIGVRLSSTVRRRFGLKPPALPKSAGLIVPEVFSAGTARALPKLFESVQGPKIAVFHDAIALKLPELSPPKTVARFPAYLEELLGFDGVAAVSNDSRQSLLEYWTWAGYKNPPPVVTLALPLLRPLPAFQSKQTDAKAKPIVLSVGTLEGRKNHVALLEACESLWAKGVDFELRLIGFAQAETGAQALQKIQELQARGRSLRYQGAVNDADLENAYRTATFTVYPSILEGFGLPVLESLAYGKPCICSGRGALGESGKGGGCVLLDRVGSEDLADAIGSLLKNPAMITLLSADAGRRTFRTWNDYHRDLRTWLSEIKTNV